MKLRFAVLAVIVAGVLVFVGVKRSQPRAVSAAPLRARASSPVPAPASPPFRPVRPGTSGAGKRLDDVVDLEAGSAAVRGHVRDENGVALPGAVVTLSGPQGDVSAVSDSQGRFEFRGLPEGAFTLLAEYAAAEGTCVSAAESAAVLRGETRTVDLVLRLQGSSVLFGRVSTDFGEPIRCNVRVYSDESGFQAGVETRPDGWYEIHGVPPGGARVRVFTTGEVSEVLAEESVQMGSSTEFSPVLRLRGREPVRVTVRDATGEPVVGAEVVLHRQKIAAWGWTGTDGSVKFGRVLPGTYTVYVRADTATAQTTATVSGETALEVILR